MHEMNDKKELYLLHLLNSMSFHKRNTLAQKGISDIDPACYESSVEFWFEQLYNLVKNNPPEYYVKAINVYEQKQNIDRIEYDYFSTHDREVRSKNAVVNLAKEP